MRTFVSEVMSLLLKTLSEKVKSLSRVRLFVTPWTVAYQAPSVYGIFQARVLEWVAISFSRGIFPTQGSNQGLPHCRQMLLPSELPGKSMVCHCFSSKEQVSFNFMAPVTVHGDFGPQENKIYHCFHIFPIYLPWSDDTRCHDLHFFECWVLSRLFHSPFAPSSSGSLVSLHFLLLGWYHLRIWGCWYFSWQSWFQLVSHLTQHEVLCTKVK